MSKLKSLGQKRICPACSAKFYDLGKHPAICPKCGHEFDPQAGLKKQKPAPTNAADEQDALAVVAPSSLSDRVHDDAVDIDDSELEDVDIHADIEEVDEMEDVDSIGDLATADDDEGINDDVTLEEEDIEANLIVDDVDDDIEIEDDDA